MFETVTLFMMTLGIFMKWRAPKAEPRSYLAAVFLESILANVELVMITEVWTPVGQV